jgi:hypothetical protein
MKIKTKIVTLLAVLVVLGSLVAIAAVPAMADVTAVTVTATPAIAGSTAGYAINFTTTANVNAAGTVTVTFPPEVTLPATISKSMIGLSGVSFAAVGDPDPTISGQSVIVTIPGGQTLLAGARTLTISQGAGIKNPAIAKSATSATAYKVTVVTSAESGNGINNVGAIGIIPSYTISAITGGRTTPVTVSGKGWIPNLGITIGGGLSGTGIALADGTFSLTAYPAVTGLVTVTDGAGQTQANSAGGIPWAPLVATSTFTITPRLEVSPASGDVGTKVTVKGYDFTSAGTIAVVTMGGVALAPGAVIFQTLDSPAYGANNDFSFVATVPATMPGGSKTVTVVDSGALNATGGFNVNTPTVTMNPMTGEPSSMVALTGTHFQAQDSIAIGGIIFATGAWNTSAVTIDASGGWSATLKVPVNAAPGNNPVRVTTNAGTVANSLFAVGTRVLTLTPASGPLGSKVLVTGANMTPRNALNPTSCINAVTFNGVAWAGAILPITIDSQGNIDPTSLAVPAGSPTGAIIVTATDNAAIPLTAVGTFTVTQPTITVSPTLGYKGDIVTVTGSGWLPGNMGLAFIRFNGQVFAVATPDASGNFTARITVPANAPDSANVGADDIALNVAASKQFLLGPAKITVSPVSGPVTTVVTVNGMGFQPQSGLQALTFAGTSALPLTPVVTDIIGKFQCTFTVPGLVEEAHAVTATVQGVTASTFFTITPAAVSVETQTASISGKLVRIWGYSDGTWQMYDPATPALNDLPALESTNGYWFKVTEPCTLVYGGFSKVLSGSDWTLVGWP